MVLKAISLGFNRFQSGKMIEQRIAWLGDENGLPRIAEKLEKVGIGFRSGGA